MPKRRRKRRGKKERAVAKKRRNSSEFLFDGFDSKDTGEGPLLPPGFIPALKAKQTQQERWKKRERDFEETFRQEKATDFKTRLGHAKYKSGTWSKGEYNSYCARRIQKGRHEFEWARESQLHIKGKQSRRVANGRRPGGQRREPDPTTGAVEISGLLDRAIKLVVGSGVQVMNS